MYMPERLELIAKWTAEQRMARYDMLPREHRDIAKEHGDAGLAKYLQEQTLKVDCQPA